MSLRKTKGTARPVPKASLERALVWLCAMGTAVSSLVLPVTANDQAHPPGPHRHAEAQVLQNPEPNTLETQARGRALYAKHCALCHGPYGLANTKLAVGMAAYGARPSDLTDRDWQHGSSDGEIFTVIRAGVGPDLHMPAFGATLEDRELWSLVHHVKSLSGLE